MLPTRPYPLSLYKRELLIRRAANCGFYHLFNVPTKHPIYDGLSDTPMVQEVYKRGIRKRVIGRAADITLHHAVDWMLDLVGTPIYRILDELGQEIAATLAMEMLIDGDDFTGLPAGTSEEYDIRMDIYGNLIARFAVAYAPQQSARAMEMLTQRCQVPYQAHLKSIHIHNLLAPVMARRIQ
jgi:hypothetical protein